MIRYQIRSVALINIVNDVNSDRLIPDAYFQRNLVWRDVHRKDFIETILNGYPFPQLFFSRGKIDINKMQSIACIVDGQQRTSAIVDFVGNKFAVNGRFFRDLPDTEKGEFLKYEIGVVELDLENDDPTIIEIFKRLNRTSNSLTVIEKLASEFAPTEYMYTARLLANNADLEDQPLEANEPNDVEDEDWRKDPNVPKELSDWAKTKQPSNFLELCDSLGIFSEREIARKVHLMYVLNIMSTIISGFFNRNEKTASLLEDLKEQFDRKDEVYDLIIRAFDFIAKLRLPKYSFWTAKANFFSLTVAVARKIEAGEPLDVQESSNRLQAFAAMPPDDYALAAREGVNNKRERQLRDGYVVNLLVSLAQF